MHYHVRITTKKTRDSIVKLDLSDDALRDRVLEPHRLGQDFMIQGKTVTWSDVDSIKISRTEVSSLELRPVVKAERERIDRASSVVVWGGPSLDWYIADFGEDVTDELLTRPPGSDVASARKSNATAVADPRVVMVVHGRDATLNEAIFTFLRAIGLDPLEWPMLRAATEKPMPYVGEVLDQAFQRAQAVVVLMTGDDLAKLQDRHLKPGDQGYERELTPQARPNVLFEAGMALASHPDRTIIVEVGDLRPFSDVAGRYVVHMTNEASDRLDLIERLQTAGCPAVQVGRGWLTAGNFSPA